MAINKPNFDYLWASGGAVVEPSDAKKQTGWVSEVPPHQWENWVQNRQDTMLAYINEAGIVEWDENTEYQANKSYVQGRLTGTIYRCLITHTNENPEEDSSGYWEVWLGDISDLAEGSLQASNNLSDLSNAATARNNLELSTVSQSEAEAGTGSTTRAWTAQRVRQAITGWWSGIRANHLPLQSSIPQVPDAETVQEALAGIGGLSTNFANAAEAQALESLTKLISPGRLGDVMNAYVLGMGQTWQDVSWSRAANTTYTNTTGRSIEVVLFGTGASGHQIQISTPAGTPPVVLGQIGGDADRESISFIVPDGAAYRVHGTASIQRWSELR